MKPDNIQAHIVNVTFILLCLAGCGTPAPTPTATFTPETPTATFVPPTATPTFTASPPPTNTGTPVPISNSDVCRLPEAAHHRDIGLGFPPYAIRMDSTGTVRAKVIFVDFPDAPASETPEQAFARISPGAPEFFNAVSYGRLNLELEPHFEWLRMSKPSAAYMFERGLTFMLHHAYLNEATLLADPEVDFSGVEAVYVIANPQARSISYGPGFTPIDQSFGIIVDGNTIVNGATSGYDIKDWGFLWLNHEAGHTLGLVDLYAFQYDVNNYNDVHRFVGGFSLMGFITGNAPEPLAYERWLLEWLDDNQIICQPNSGEIMTISAIEVAGGTKAIMVPTGRTSAVVIESRRPFGYDAKLVKSGALVYSVDTAIPTGEGPIKIFPALPNDPYRDRSPLAVGESVTIGNVTVTVIDASADSDTVQVTVTK